MPKMEAEGILGQDISLLGTEGEDWYMRQGKKKSNYDIANVSLLSPSFSLHVPEFIRCPNILIGAL